MSNSEDLCAARMKISSQVFGNNSNFDSILLNYKPADAAAGRIEVIAEMWMDDEVGLLDIHGTLMEEVEVGVLEGTLDERWEVAVDADAEEGIDVNHTTLRRSISRTTPTYR
jgi:hypothetical protein